MLRKFSLISMILVLSLSLFAVGCSSSEEISTTPNKELEEKGESSQELIIYSGRKEQLVKPIIDKFSEETGIKVTVQYGDASEMANKIIAEKNNPQADLILTNDAGIIEKLRIDGLLQPINTDLSVIPSDLRAEDNTWTGISARYRVIMYNKDLVGEGQLPESFFDLTKHEYKDKVMMAHGGNESLVSQVTAVRYVQGDDVAKGWLQGLLDNGVTLTKGHTDIRKAVGAGEKPFGIVNQYYAYLQLAESENNNIGIIIPDQKDGQMGTLVNVSAAGILKGSKNADASEQFIAYLISPEVQKLYAEISKETPLVAGVPTVDGAPQIADFKRVDMNLDILGVELDSTNELIDSIGGLPVQQ